MWSEDTRIVKGKGMGTQHRSDASLPHKHVFNVYGHALLGHISVKK